MIEALKSAAVFPLKMRNLILPIPIILVLYPLLAFSSQNEYGIKFVIDSPVTSYHIDGATCAISYRFVAQNTNRVGKIRFYCGVYGEPRYYRVALCSDKGGFVGDVISSTEVYSGATSAGKWIIADIPDVDIVKGNVYHILISSTVFSQPYEINSSTYINPRATSPNNSFLPLYTSTAEYNFLCYSCGSGLWEEKNLQPVYVIEYVDGTVEGNPYIGYSGPGAGFSVGGSTSVGVEFVPSGDITAESIGVYIRKYGIPADDIYYELRGPDEFYILIESGVFVNQAAVSTAFSWVSAPLFLKRTFQKGHKYWLLFKSPNTSTTANTYLINILNTGTTTKLYNYATYGGTDTVYVKYLSDVDVLVRDEQRDLVFNFTLFIDTIPPAPVTDLHAAEGDSDGEVALYWSSPGDDNLEGELIDALYEIKIATFYISSTNCDSIAHNPLYTYVITIPTSGVKPCELQKITITGLYPGTTYYFAVKTKDDAGNWSVWLGTNNIINVNSASPAKDLPPNKVNNIKIAAGDRKITLTWDIMPPARGFDDYDKFLIYRSTTGGFYFPYDNFSIVVATIHYVTGNLTYTFVDTGVINHITYYYRISVWDSGSLGDGLCSVPLESFSDIEVSAYPSSEPLPPQKVRWNYNYTFPLSTAAIHWCWEDVLNEAGYKIKNAITNSTIAELPQDTTYYVEPDLLPNSQYQRVIVATNTAGESESSEVIKVYTLALPPKDLFIAEVSSSSVKLKWSSSGATLYRIERSTDSKFWLIVSTTNYTAFVDTYNLSPDTSYYWRICAINGDNIPNTAEFSNTVSTNTLLQIPLVKKRTPDIVISQVATRGPFNANDEFIELYNTSRKYVNLYGWKLQYRSAKSTSFTQWLTIDTTVYVQPYGFFLIVVNTAVFTTDGRDVTPDINLNRSIGMGDDAEIRILDNEGRKVDAVAFGKGHISCEECYPAPNHGTSPNNYSIVRKRNYLGIYIDTDMNDVDFVVSSDTALGTPTGRRYPRNSSSPPQGPELVPPANISDLVAYPGNVDGEVVLSWTAPGDDGTTGALNNAKYRIKFSTSSHEVSYFSSEDSYNISFSTTNVSPLTKVSYKVTGLHPGTTYYFGVILSDDVDNWNIFISSSVVNNKNYTYAPDFPPPNVPYLHVKQRNQQLELSWSNPTDMPYDLVKYEIYCDTTSKNFLNKFLLYTVDAVKGEYTYKYIHTGLTNGLTHYYQIYSIDSGDLGNGFYSSVLRSTYSTESYGRPRVQPPRNVVAKHYGDYVNISWSVPSDEIISSIAGCNIYRRSEDETDYKMVAYNVKLTEYFYKDTNVVKTKKYYYMIRTTDTFCITNDDYWESVDSDVAEAKSDLLPPRIVYVTKLNERIFGKAQAVIEVEVLDDRYIENDNAGKIVYVGGKYRKIGELGEYTLHFAPVFSSDSKYVGKAEINFTTIGGITEGIEYYIEAQDEINIVRWPSEGNSWYSVSLGGAGSDKVRPTQRFITPANTEVVFGKGATFVSIRDLNGNLVWDSRSSSIPIIWYGKDMNDVPVESGTYIYEITTDRGDKKFGIIIVVR
jgi:hypothetical protein